MYRTALLCSALIAFTGCIAVHAQLPEEFMDNVTVQVRDVQIGTICTYDGRAYSVGSSHCMGGRRMQCENGGAWVDGGNC